MPYDWDGIAEAREVTSRVIIAHEDQLTCGFGAEIAARISDELFEYLDAPVKRVAPWTVRSRPAPTSRKWILPQSSRRARRRFGSRRNTEDPSPGCRQRLLSFAAPIPPSVEILRASGGTLMIIFLLSLETTEL